MKRAAAELRIDRYTPIENLAAAVRRILRRWLGLIGLLLAVETGILSNSSGANAAAFGMIAAGVWIALAVWSRFGRGVPLLPVLIVQAFFIYGLPLAFGHEIIATYKDTYVIEAGREVLIFCLATALAWRLATAFFAVARPVSYALVDVNRDGLKGLRRLGFVLIITSVVYQVMLSLQLVDLFIRLLPSGVAPIVVAVTAACGACGFFLVAMGLSSGQLSQQVRLAFWALFLASCLLDAASFLLSTVALNVMSVAIGIFWGSGRFPWRYLVVIGVILSFFNVGKLTMRQRYWNFDEGTPENDTRLQDIPATYMEWFQASVDTLTNPADQRATGFYKGRAKEAAQKQTLFDRIDNLQNLLFVINAEEDQKIPPVGGQTYSIIPALLVPRIMWPDKPRSHAGQVILNVYFGRQDLLSTERSYVAWGLLPEAYGNYGPFIGSVVLGLVLGAIFGWLENFTARKLLISLEGFLAFDFLLNIANSSEMVASVFVTALAQSMVPIIVACAPFVRRMYSERPAETEEPNPN